MLTSIESSFILSLPCGNDENAYVGQRGTADHAGDVCFVAWRVEDGILPFVGLEVAASHLDSLSLGSLFVR